MHEIIYYKDDNDESPLIDFLRSLPVKDRAKVLREIDLLSQFGIKLTMPHVKKMKTKNDLWELRVKISTNNYRVFYFHHTQDRFVLLHGFLKKSQKTPKRHINIALDRKQRYLERNE